jgi:hypothetical protein
VSDSRNIPRTTMSKLVDGMQGDGHLQMVIDQARWNISCNVSESIEAALQSVVRVLQNKE